MNTLNFPIHWSNQLKVVEKIGGHNVSTTYN